MRERVKRRMAEEGIPVGSDDPTLQALGAPPLHRLLKPFTKYICPIGHGQLGHSSIWTGAYDVERTKRPSDGICICGAEMVEEASTQDGHRYRLLFETIDPHQAETFEQHYGTAIWRNLNDVEWGALSWHEVSREADTPSEITAQYENLLAWAESHEQPIRNVRLERSAASAWEPA